MPELAPVVEEYLESMERFCRENFGTTDLRVCRQRLEEAYEKVWE
ncbi:MAG: hypothetical protein ACTSPB_14795 [Candidatus Thorarchaeota archaeon]